MDTKEAQQKIAALKSIIQTLMPELYWTQAEGGTQANFGALVEDDDPVATAIANELTEPEIDEGFAWIDRARGSAEAEMRATPIVPFLNPEQTERMRIKLEAIDKPANALTTRRASCCG